MYFHCELIKYKNAINPNHPKRSSLSHTKPHPEIQRSNFTMILLNTTLSANVVVSFYLLTWLHAIPVIHWRSESKPSGRNVLSRLSLGLPLKCWCFWIRKKIWSIFSESSDHGNFEERNSDQEGQWSLGFPGNPLTIVVFQGFLVYPSIRLVLFWGRYSSYVIWLCYDLVCHFLFFSIPENYYASSV